MYINSLTYSTNIYWMPICDMPKPVIKRHGEYNDE